MSRSKARRKTKDLAPAPPPPKPAFLCKPLIPEVLISLFLITATLAVFWSVKNFDFLTLDDEEYVTENPHVQVGLTAKGVLWAFTTMHASNWHPLTWLSHMLDGVLYGLSPGGHHLTNLLFHITSTLLLFWLFKRMTGGLWRSGWVALLFALHPLHVESVAWVSERKDVLSTFLWMLTMWTYVAYANRPSQGRYGLVFLSFALGLLSKPMLVTLPFVLLLVDYWPLRRFPTEPAKNLYDSQSKTSLRSVAFHLIWEKVPFFVLVAVSSVLTLVAQRGAIASLEVIPLGTRIANALISYVCYIGKTIWPSGLAVQYPYSSQFPMWEVAGAALILVGVSVWVIWEGRRRPYLGMGWSWYLGTLIPVIGLVQVGAQAMADRYTYVPLIGLFIMMVWGISDLLAGWRYQRALLSASALLLITVLTFLTRTQLQYWSNSVTLFKRSLNVTVDNYLSHNSYGVVLARKGKNEEAITHFTEALKLRPNFAKAHNGLGVALSRQANYQEAILHYNEALRIKKDYAEAYNNLGVALARQGKVQEAFIHYKEALRIMPLSVDAHYNIGNLFGLQGNYQEAIYHFTEILKIKPNDVEVHYNIGVALAEQGKNEEAITHFTEALRLKPNFSEAHFSLGLAYLTIGNRNSALEEYKVLKTINPDLANTLSRKIFE